MRLLLDTCTFIWLMTGERALPSHVRAALQDADLAAIVTAHPGVDHDSVMRELPGSCDFRGVTRHLRRAPAPQA